MLGRRRNAGRVPDAPSQAPAHARDGWRTLPTLPTIMRASALTVAPDAFRDSLRSWHNPSFLAPLSHQIDDSGPAGLIVGLPATPAGQQPVAGYPDHPLPPADGGGAPVQRTVASWRFPSPPRQSLVLAPEPELEPVPFPVVPAHSEETGAASAAPVALTSQEPGTADMAGRPAASVMPEGRLDLPAAEVRPAAPMSRPAEAATLGQPPPVQRNSADVTAPLQPSQASRQTPPRRLGLGAPLSDVPGGPAARSAPVPPDLPVARLFGPTAPGGRGVPGETAPVRRGNEPDPAPLERPGVVAGSLTGRAETVEPGQAVLQRSAEPDAGDQSGPTVHGSPSEAPLLGGLPLVMRSDEPPPAGPAAGAAQQTPSVPAGSRLSSAPPVPPFTPPTPVQRLANPPTAQGGGLERSPAGLPLTPQPEGRGPTFGGLSPPQRPAGQPGPALAGERSATSLLPYAAAVGLVPVHAASAPLVGQRQPASTLSTSFQDPPGPVPVQAAGAPGAPARASAAAVPPAVQRSFADRTLASSRSGHATILPGGPAHRDHPPALGADPGAIAIARGIAHRDSDGSIVFDLSPPPVVSRSVSASTRHERPAEPGGASGSPGIVQRDDASAPAASSDGPAGDVPSPAASSATPAAAPSPAPAAQTPASPPLDELARQLFDPLAARLKAELRLDRERAGLLTDMRQ